MDAIADDLGVEIVVSKDDACNTGLTVVEHAHGVEGVRSARGASCDACLCLCCNRIGVADTDLDAKLVRVGDEFDCTLRLRGDGDEANVPTRGLPEAVEELDGGSLDLGGRMNSALGMGDKGTFEVNADRCGSVGISTLLDVVGDALKRAQRM